MSFNTTEDYVLLEVPPLPDGATVAALLQERPPVSFFRTPPPRHCALGGRIVSVGRSTEERGARLATAARCTRRSRDSLRAATERSARRLLLLPHATAARLHSVNNRFCTVSVGESTEDAQ